MSRRLARRLAVGVLGAAVSALLGACTSATGGHANAAEGHASFTNPTVVAAAVGAARRDIAIINSYDYRHLTEALTAALAVGDDSMRVKLQTTFTSALEPQAPKVKAAQTAVVSRAGITSLDAAGTTAVVLVWGQLNIVNTVHTTPLQTIFGASVTMKLVGNLWLVDDFTDDTGSIPLGPAPGTPALLAAAKAGQNEAAACTTFSRKTYGADFDRALSGATGKLRSDLSTRQSQTLAVLTQGRYDLTADVTAFAVENVSDSSVQVLATMHGRKVADDPAKTATTVQRLEITMTKVGGLWLASNINTIALP